MQFEDLLTSEEKLRLRSEVRKLSTIVPWKGLLVMAVDWMVIAAVIFAAVQLHSIWISALAIFIIGSRQHALLLIMHDTAHHRLIHDRRFDTDIANLFCAFPLFITTSKYRQSHLAHHKFLNTEQDPDWMLRKGLEEWTFPKSKADVIGLLLKQLLGLNTLHILAKLRRFGGTNATSATTESRSSRAWLRMVFYAAVLTSLTAWGGWKIFLVYWLIPAFTVLPFLLRLRSLSEHFGLVWTHELNSSRNVNAGFFERCFLVPHSGHLHLDHHLYPSVPFYNLKKLHQVLLEIPAYRNLAANNSSYLKVWSAGSVIEDLSR